MRRRPFLFPWQKKCTLTCAQCGGKIVVSPMWHWENKEDKIRKLQPQFCHTIDAGIIDQIPMLSENDWIASKKAGAYDDEFFDEAGQKRSYEDIKHMVVAYQQPPQIFLKHGIFPLIQFLSETQLKALYLTLCLSANQYFMQTFLLQTMQISRPHVSGILKKFNNLRFLIVGRPQAKGRAHGRIRAYALTNETRSRLDKDLAQFEFFRIDVRTTVRPIALCFRELKWRTDLGLLERENGQPSTARSSGLG